MWIDGTRVLQKTGKNKYDDDAGVYTKFGIYKWEWLANPTNSNTSVRVVYHDELRIGDAGARREDVQPRR